MLQPNEVEQNIANLCKLKEQIIRHYDRLTRVAPDKIQKSHKMIVCGGSNISAKSYLNRFTCQSHSKPMVSTFFWDTHTHTTVLLLVWNMSGSTRVRYQKGKTKKVKTNLDLLEQEIVSGSGICWAICKSAPHPRQSRQHPTTQTQCISEM